MDIRGALRKPSPDGLFDEQHAGKIGPAVLVRRRNCLTITPAKWLSNKESMVDGWKRMDEYATRTPFSCNKPSREEHPGPPFVLTTIHNSIIVCLGKGCSPENKVIKTSLWTGREEPEEELLNRKSVDTTFTPKQKEVGHTHFSRLAWVAAYWQQPGPAGPDIEIDLGDGCSVNVELYQSSSPLRQSSPPVGYFTGERPYVREALGFENVMFLTAPPLASSEIKLSNFGAVTCW